MVPTTTQRHDPSLQSMLLTMYAVRQNYRLLFYRAISLSLSPSTSFVHHTLAPELDSQPCGELHNAVAEDGYGPAGHFVMYPCHTLGPFLKSSYTVRLQS